MQRISPRQAARIRYKLYESALSSGIDSDTYHAVVTEGFFDNLLKKIASKFKKKGKGSDAAEDPDVEKVYATAGEEIKTAIKKLFDISAQKKLPRDQTLEWVKAFVDSILKETQASAPEAGSGGGGGGESGGGTGGGGGAVTVTQGAVPAVTDGSAPVSDSPAAQDAASLAAAVAGRPPETGPEAAEDKGWTADQVMDFLYSAVAQASGQDEALVKKVIDYITKNKVKLAEGRLPTIHLYRQLTRSLLEERSRRRNAQLLERWQRLAGVRLFETLGSDRVNSLVRDSRGDLGRLARDLGKDDAGKLDDNDKRDLTAAWDAAYQEKKDELKNNWEDLKSGRLGERAEEEEGLEGPDKQALSELPAASKKAIQTLVAAKVGEKPAVLKIVAVLARGVKKRDSESGGATPAQPAAT